MYIIVDNILSGETTSVHDFVSGWASMSDVNNINIAVSTAIMMCTRYR